MQNQVLTTPFARGLDTKSDPWQVEAGSLLALSNAVFDSQGMLTKRNGFAPLTTSEDATSVTTLGNALISLGPTLQVYSESSNTWASKGTSVPVRLSTLSASQSSANLTVADSATAPNGMICNVFYDSVNGIRYNILDETGAEIRATSVLSASGRNPRVVVVQGLFVIVYGTTTPAIAYSAVYTGDPNGTPITGVFSTTLAAVTSPFDIIPALGGLFAAWTASGSETRYSFITFEQIVTGNAISEAALAAAVPTSIAVAFDADTLNGWVVYYNGTDLRALCVNQTLATVLSVTTITAAGDAKPRISAMAEEGVCTAYYELASTYSGTGATNRTNYRTITEAGSVGTDTLIIRGMGLASKVFDVDGSRYFLGAFFDSSQPSYFLLAAPSGAVVARLAYSNGIGYLSNFVLPSVTVTDNVATIGYLRRNQLIPVNKAEGSAAAAFYSLAGLNLARFVIGSNIQQSAELSSTLHLTGGKVNTFDGANLSEQNFNVYPEVVDITTATTGGNLADQSYYYVFVYEWTDANGVIHRSAPSLPILETTGGGGASVNTVRVSNLRCTAKSGVRLVGYRWSTAQPIFYQFTSVTAPTLNSTTADSTTFADGAADASIAGNPVLYVTGGVVENIAPPGLNHMTVFKSRLVGINAENTNEIWYSKQVLPGTPVEFSDLFTQYIAPTAAAPSTAGGATALAAMDDKLIIFTRNAIFYMTGNGPDATGANNDFSEPVFITSAVGCTEPESIVMTPLGLMFKSDKGIWMLGRGLDTKYIGAAVEAFNDEDVNSAVLVPNTNQVRFGLSSGTVLMYDYFYDQWGTFTGNSSISSCIYQNLHTTLSSTGSIRRELPGTYLDGSRPVTISFTTAWLKLSGLQGFQRAKQLFLLSNYLTPHKLIVTIRYDYNEANLQQTVISPTNFSGVFGSEALFGSLNPFGGSSTVEQWRIFLRLQKCQSVQISVQEQYDPTQTITLNYDDANSTTAAVAAGAGLTFSGISMLVGVKGNSPKLNSTQSAG